MSITALGGIGVGLVWGWLVGRFPLPLHRQPLSTTGYATATLLLATEIFVLAHPEATVLFLAASVLGFWLRLAWHRELRIRFGSSR